MAMAAVLHIIISAVIVTSNYDLYYITKAVVDPSHEVYYLVDETEIKGEEFRPQEFHIRLLNRADVFIHTGTFERKWLAQALWEARNPKILEGREGHIDISKYIQLQNSSSCFILKKDYVKRVATVLSGLLRKLSPDFSNEFYEKRLSDFFAEVDKFFSELSTFTAIIPENFSIYSPCIKYFTDEFGLKHKLMIKKKDTEVFSYRAARDAAEIMKRINSPLLVVPYDIERDAEIGFISAEIPMIKIPTHLGKKYKDFSSIIKGITIIGTIPTAKAPEKVPETGVQPALERKEIMQIPPEPPRLEIQQYGYITSRYTSVVLRDRPSSTAAQAGRISGGQRVLILEKQNEWVKVTDGRNIGWVRSSVITLEKNGTVQ